MNTATPGITNPWHSVSIDALSTMVSYINLNKKTLPEESSQPLIAAETESQVDSPEKNLLSVGYNKVPSWRSEQIMIQHSLQVSQQDIVSRSQPLHTTPFETFLGSQNDVYIEEQLADSPESLLDSGNNINVEPPGFSFTVDEAQGPLISIIDEPRIDVMVTPEFNAAQIIVSVEEPGNDPTGELKVSQLIIKRTSQSNYLESRYCLTLNGV